ncbi:lanthionine synthetase C family protein [Streptomyces sp. NPDC047130]|uniref:lanthionine synthetase C family protein n=1 Tax=Streptomyces sp. NPDC047130 TaxID=3155261 RepID=UPI0033EFAD3D
MTPPDPRWGQSLYRGAAGIALAQLHTDPQKLTKSAAAMLRGPLGAGGLYEGAPSVAYTLLHADTPAARRALTQLAPHVRDMTRARLELAHRRIDAGVPPVKDEFDVITGLTGLGVYHLAAGDRDEATAIAAYLVRLTEPLTHSGVTVPGWWSTTPAMNQATPEDADGNGIFGMAHGIAGPLAYLALCTLRGITTEGHDTAIARICGHLAEWRLGTGQDAHWPYWVTLAEHARGVPHAGTGPARPSWCYGTPGIARALHLAGRAMNDTRLQHQAEQALTGCTRHTHLFTDLSLCHGWAGLLQAVRRTAADSAGSSLQTVLLHLEDKLATPSGDNDPSLMEGAAGIDLVRANPPTDWDLCLLLPS